MTALPEQFHRDAYIELLKRSITNYHYLGGDTPFENFRCVVHYDVPAGQWKIGRRARPCTLLSKSQLDLIESAVRMVEEGGVPGDAPQHVQQEGSRPHRGAVSLAPAVSTSSSSCTISPWSLPSRHRLKLLPSV